MDLDGTWRSEETERPECTQVAKQVIARYIGRDEVYWSIRTAAHGSYMMFEKRVGSRLTKAN